MTNNNSENFDKNPACDQCASPVPRIGWQAPWLAPLAGHTDLVFRVLCRELGAAVTCTEMVSAKGLIYGERSRKGCNNTVELLRTLYLESRPREAAALPGEAGAGRSADAAGPTSPASLASLAKQVGSRSSTNSVRSCCSAGSGSSAEPAGSTGSSCPESGGASVYKDALNAARAVEDNDSPAAIVARARNAAQMRGELLLPAGFPAPPNADSPLVVQLFGDEPEFLGQSVALLRSWGFEWFDLNLGCSVPKVTRAGAGAALARDLNKTLEAARLMIREAGGLDCEQAAFAAGPGYTQGGENRPGNGSDYNPGCKFGCVHDGFCGASGTLGAPGLSGIPGTLCAAGIPGASGILSAPGACSTFGVSGAPRMTDTSCIPGAPGIWGASGGASACMAQPVRGRVGFKIRLGWSASEENYLDLAKGLEQCGAAWITLHPRYARQAFSGTADWTALARLRRAVSIPVMASGDLFDAASALRCLQETGVDGAMFARGALHNPAVFADYLALTMAQAPTLMPGGAVRTGESGESGGSGAPGASAADLPGILPQRAEFLRAVILRHAELAQALPVTDRQRRGDKRRERNDRPDGALLKMRGAIPRYVKDLPGSRAFRVAMSRCASWNEFYELVEAFFAAVREQGERCGA